MNPWAPAGLHAEPNFAYRLTAHARSRWFALRSGHVHFRRHFAYLDGGTVLPLCQQCYGGSAHRWGFAIYPAAHDNYHDCALPTGHAQTP